MSAPAVEPLRAPSSRETSSIESRVRSFQGSQIALVLIALIAIFSAVEPDTFFTLSNLRSILFNTSILAVLGVGMTFVIITGGIDLSNGSVLVFSSVLASEAMEALGGKGWIVSSAGIIVACASGLAWGLFNGVIIAKAKLPPLIVTLGSLGMALGMAQILTGGIDVRHVPQVLVDTVGFGQIFEQIPILVIIAAVIVVLGAVLLHGTRFGLYTFGIGSNEQACRRVGINTDRHLIMVYALSGLSAGIGGILSLAYFQTTTLSGQSHTNLNVIAGVVIGGTSLFGGSGSIFGTVVGLFVPYVLLNGFVILGIQPFWQQVVVGSVLIAAVYVDQRRRESAARGKSKPLLRKLIGRKE